MEPIPASILADITTHTNRVISQIYNGKIKSPVDIGLLSVVGQALENQVNEGFGKTFLSVDFNTPDGIMLSRITRDVWTFSAAKNYQQLRDFTDALKDESGKLRTFSEFKEAAGKIAETHGNWLKTEYNLAVGSSTMAARWVDFEANADEMPFLQYITVGDTNVRDEHARLNNIIRKINDEFWATHYPPNGWGCRCSANQLATSVVGETEVIPQVTIPAMFRTNLAKSGLIFPKDHAYYNGIPKNVLTDAVAVLPRNVAYKKVYENPLSAGTVKIHILHGKKEMANNVAQAEYLADMGHNIELLPDLGNAPDSIRKQIFGKLKFMSRKNPDALVDGEIFEFKKFKASESTIDNNFRDAKKQATNMVLWFKNDISSAEITRLVGKRIDNSKFEGKVWIFTNNHELIKLQ